MLKLSRQPYYRWLAAPVTTSELVEAYRANALFDAHGEDPEFGHRLLVDEARDAGEVMVDRTAWRICAANGWWSSFGKKPGPPVHDDLCAVTGEDGKVRHEFIRVLLTRHRNHRPSSVATTAGIQAGEGKLYVCAVKDVFSNRIVGYWHRLEDEVDACRLRAGDGGCSSR